MRLFIHMKALIPTNYEHLHLNDTCISRIVLLSTVHQDLEISLAQQKYQLYSFFYTWIVCIIFKINILSVA